MKKLLLFDYVGKTIVSDRPRRKFPRAKLSAERLPINILILGDGFTRNRISEFYNARAKVIKHIYNTPPFNYLRTYINIFSVRTYSNHYGPGTVGTQNTKFGTYFESIETTNTLMTLDPDKLYNYIINLEYNKYDFDLNGYDEWLNENSQNYGLIGVITPSKRCGGTRHSGVKTHSSNNISFFIASTSSKTYFAVTFLHELGHACGLADEYENDESSKNGIVPVEGLEYFRYPDNTTIYPNIICKKELNSNHDHDILNDVNFNEFKWKDYMTKNEFDKLTFIPNPASNEFEANRKMYPGTKWDEVILCEGAHYFRRDVYRPNWNCIMRYQYYHNTYQPRFCKICHFTIVEKILGTKGVSLP